MHYLDHAATTPVLPEVREAMFAALEHDFGNPSSVHGFGRRARELVEDAPGPCRRSDRRQPGRDRVHGGRDRGRQPGPQRSSLEVARERSPPRR